MALAAISPLRAQDQKYELRVLTFEDADWKGSTNMYGESGWTSLIDNPQYGGEKLYGTGSGVSDPKEAYQWTDQNNTFLFNRLSEGYGSYCYWSGGHAISNYGTADYQTYGDFTNQLSVYNENGTDEVTQSGHGHNGSNNFAVHFGYADNSGFGLGEDALPFLEFADGVARVIDHMYINSTCYALNCYLNGNNLTEPIGPDDWVKIVAKGYKDDSHVGTVEFPMVDGDGLCIKDWTKFDLSPLGEVNKVTFNIMGTNDNGAGFSQPAYFAYDDVAVRFPISSVADLEANDPEAEVRYFTITGMRVDEPTAPGLYIRRQGGKSTKILVK